MTDRPTRPRPFLALAALLVAGSLAFAQPAAVDLSTSMTNDEVGFSMAYPPAWAVVTYPGANQVDFIDDLSFLLVDAFERSLLPADDADELLAIMVEMLAADIDGAELTPLDPRLIAGLDAVGVAYTGRDEDWDIQGWLWVMLDASYAYVINAESEVETFAAYAPTFEAMLDSFQVGLED